MPNVNELYEMASENEINIEANGAGIEANKTRIDDIILGMRSMAYRVGAVEAKVDKCCHAVFDDPDLVTEQAEIRYRLGKLEAKHNRRRPPPSPKP